MNDSPKFSIIIPTFNHADLIKKCLDSIVSQTEKDWEAIVVNNFSSDNTIEVVESYNDPRIKLINFDNGGVIAAGRNEGIRQSKGEWVAFLDSDDWWTNKKLEKCNPFLNENDILFHDLDYHTKNGATGKVKHCRELSSPVFEDLILHGNEIICSSVVLRRSLLEKVEGFNENKLLFGVEDCDLWIRISKETNRFYYLSESLGSYWLGDNNNSMPSPLYVERYHFLYSQYLEEVRPKKRKAAEAFLKYAVARQSHKSGELKSSKVYFSALINLNTLKLKLKSLFFGISFLVFHR